MQRISIAFAVIISITMAAGCASNSGGSPMAASGEKLIWSSEKERPKWTLKEPELDGPYMFFVGLSDDVANEQMSRDDAYKNSTRKVVQYIGNLAKVKYERALVSSGLAGDVKDPTLIESDVEKQVSAAASRNLKAMKWYLEKWEKPTGVAWKSFVIARIPTSALEDSYADSMNSAIRDAQKKQKAANNETAKKQLDRYLEMLKKLKDQGVTSD